MSKYHRALADIDAPAVNGPTVENEPPANILTVEDARRIGEQIGIDWDTVEFPVEEFAAGLIVEREHGPVGAGGERTNVSRGDPLVEGQIAWVHLLELPDYYTRLDGMENEGNAELGLTKGDGGPSKNPDDYAEPTENKG